MTKVFWIGLAVLVVLIATVWVRHRNAPIRSFWDLVRNPSKGPDFNRMRADVAEHAARIADSPAEIAKLVDQFVFEAASSDSAWHEKKVLAALGEKAFPRALQILQDESLFPRLVQLAETDHLPEAPINRLCDLLDQEVPPPRAAAPLLARFLDSPSEEIRRGAALAIGSIGSEDSLADLRKALSDPDEYVRGIALIGLNRAIEGDRIGEPAKGLFFDAVASMWPADTAFNVCDYIPKILLKLDRSRAIERLMGRELFTPQFKPLWRILEAFKKENVSVPIESLLSLIGEIRKQPPSYPFGNMLGQALALLGSHRNPEDLETLEHFVGDREENIAEGAVEGLRRYYNLDETLRDPWEVVEQLGWEALTPAEKHLCAVETLNDEVNNGGFAQYYFNSSGDHWADALAGLEAMGAVQHAELVRDTLRSFPDGRPSKHHGTRNEQLAKIARKEEQPFNKVQDQAWYGLKDENLGALSFRYSLANLAGRQINETGSDQAGR
jgi:hypothetical protein